MDSHPVPGDRMPPLVQPRPSDEKGSLPTSNIDGEEQAAVNVVDAHLERISTFKDYLRVFTYATTFDYVLMIPAAVASIGAGVTLPLMNVVFGLLIGEFNDYFHPNSTAKESEFVRSLDRMALYLFILFLTRLFLNYVNKFTFRIIGIRMSAAIRAHYLRCLFMQTIHVLDSMPPGSAAGTITAASNTLQLGISEKLGVFIEFTASMIAAIAVAFTYSWSLTLVTASSIVFISLALGVLLPVVLKQQANQDKAETRANAVASEAFGSIRMIAACGAEGRVAQRFKEWVNEAKRYGLVTSPLYALQFGLIFFSLYATYALAFWYGTKSYYEGRVSGVSTVIVVLMSVMILVVSMERISSPLIAIGKAQVAATTFFTVIDAPRPETGSLSAPDVTATENIVFRDCTFAYPGRPSKKVLDKLNLTIEAGKTTAIVGPSGSGKSTIVGLLERWYSLHDQVGIAKVKETPKGKNTKEMDKEETDENGGPPGGLAVDDSGPPVQLGGSISTCGRELDEISLRWWRSQIGLVQQEPFLFNDTIFSNVACGLVGTEFENECEEKKRELVVEACKEAFADEFIDRLPDRYDTAVGDSGAKVSGGQRQRIAIARSIISRPKILILDEATSAIDVHGERIVQHALERASRGRTTIMIAHRLSTIKKADHIVVIQSGRIVEEGTHGSLLSNEGSVYSSLVHAQKLALGDRGEDFQLEEEDVAAILRRERSAAEPEADGVAQEEGEEEESNFKVKKTTTFNLASGVGRLLYEQRSKWPIYIVALAAAVAVAAAMPVQAYLFASVIVAFQETGAAFVDNSRFWSLMWLILGIAVGVSYFILGFSTTQVEHRVGATYRQEYFESILGQRIAYFDEEGHAAGTLTSQALGDPKKFQDLLGVQGTQAYIGVFNLLGGLIISFIYSWKLSLLSFFVVMPIGLFCGYYRLKYEVEFNKLYEAVFAESSKWASESIGAIRTVSSLTLEDAICRRYQDLLDGHVSSAIKKARYSSIVFALSDSLSMGCQALIFWVGGHWLASGEVSILGFFIVFMAIMSGAEGTGQLLGLAPNASQATAASNRILRARETKLRNTMAADERVENVDGGIKIELRDVHFNYPTRKVWVLKGINITVEKGQFAALVGASGSGKTSVISLIERFYDVSRGQILFNDKDIYSVNVGEYRKLISLVAQEPSLLQGTIRENILLGVNPSTVADEQLHQACRDASIHDFIISLPEGYDSNVGSRGVTLSGGQKQRVAIARALIRDPRVLLLDEATSSLDSENEKLVQAALERAARGRTTIAVAHRLATIQRAQVVFVLGEGRVLEVGSHAELLRKKGVYWHMCQSQALDK